MSHNTSVSVVARQAVVSGSSGLTGGLPQITTRVSSVAQAASVLCVSQSTRESKTSRVLVVQGSLRDRGFSEEVSAHIAGPSRPSSLEVYQSKWAIFCAWCDGRKVDPLQATAPLIAEFLSEKFKTGLAFSTLAGYRTAIAKTLVHHTGIDFGGDKNLSSLLHSFELERSAHRNPVPDWDLALVLNCLLRDPFEPSDKVPLKILTWKTVFLLALASGKRRSEIHALSYSALSWSED